jgi:hypothetical protein
VAQTATQAKYEFMVQVTQRIIALAYNGASKL